MIELDGDIAIIGAGFGGSLCSLIAQRCGLRPILIERGQHPRFALGESSTPITNLALAGLAKCYDLPRVTPISKYGTWRRTYPAVMRGVKRGFSYFHHRSGEPFVPQPDRSTELLVGANPDDERGDTHWLRSDVDHFLVQEAVAAGVAYLDRTELTMIDDARPWRLTAQRDAEPVRIAADFIIDASGDGSVLARALNIANDLSHIRTHSRALYSHFRGVRRWQDIYAELGGSFREHPFPCDAAALHHVFDGGWMWVLRFDHGVTSAGFSLDPACFPLGADLSPDDEWVALLRRFPSIAAQFEHAVPLMPLRRTGRLQRCRAEVAGLNWAMLPSAAGVIDALFSTGIAHTLTGIERLMPILAETRPGDERQRRLRDYHHQVRSEIGHIDLLVHGCYQTFAPFTPMTWYSMLYFAAATCSEEQRRCGAGAISGFLLSGDPEFRALVARAHTVVDHFAERADVCASEALALAVELTRALRPYNIAGLCDSARHNLYPYVGPT